MFSKSIGFGISKVINRNSVEFFFETDLSVQNFTLQAHKIIINSFAKCCIKLPKGWNITPYYSTGRYGIYIGPSMSYENTNPKFPFEILDLPIHVNNQLPKNHAEKIISTLKLIFDQLLSRPNDYKILYYENRGTIIIEFKENDIYIKNFTVFPNNTFSPTSVPVFGLSELKLFV